MWKISEKINLLIEKVNSQKKERLNKKLENMFMIEREKKIKFENKKKKMVRV